MVSARFASAATAVWLLVTLSCQALAAVYINCGSSTSFTDSQGKTWQKDADYTGGIVSTSATITNKLSKDSRYFTTVGSGIGYKIPAGSAGTYDVTLHFVESYFTAAGKRQFKAYVQGTSVTTGYIDIYTLAGGAGKFYNKTVSAYTSDGYISITFSKYINYPTIAGISVTAASSSSPCKAVLWTESFSSSTLTNFDVYNCASGVSVSGGKLTLKLIENCGGSIIKSKYAYTSGYAEAVVQLGGQGASYSGLVYTFITQSDPTKTNPDEIDVEILGKNTGQIQTNMYVNGSGYNVNYQPFSGYSMVSQSVKLGIKWKSSEIQWYVNGNLVRTRSNAGFTKSQYVWSSIWDGSSVSSWAGTVNWASGPTSNYKMTIDSIKFCSTS
eukprot:TRINITY_DN3271_c0_g1_i1.p1 TRINITY_DN3271_c0_g1~~TRINITY_DN3271_c0_g1_i1.p1  ORF type:complete len:384 (-),score=109.28 TRINITY_DN3271_c0_g1_i1:126-1277(-)